MSDDAVLNTLRSVRRSDDVVDRLKAQSLEARRERIAEALSNPSWDAGPARLIATYSHHALADKVGTLMRVGISEDDDGEIEIGKVEVLQIPVPPSDVGREVMETAKSAVDRIYENDVDGAAPMVAAIANALYTSGSLRNRIMSEVDARSVSRSAWWHNVVSEHMEKIGQAVETLTIAQVNDHESLVEAVDGLQGVLTDAAKIAASAMEQLSDAPKIIEMAAEDIASDLKYAIRALSGVDRDRDEELTGVYEAVATVAPQLQFGARFLEHLVRGDESRAT